MSDGKSMFFRKVGGRHQLVLDSPAALFQLLELDDAHWMATSAPVETFNCDLAFTKFLDSDGNGRIRSDELRAACEWILSALGDVSVLADSSDVLSLSAINSETEVGKALRASAELMLANLNAENTSEITLVQTRCRQDILSSGECNGDGVIPVSTLKDAELADFLSDVIAVSGGAPDAGGGEGVTSEIVDKFMSDLNSYLEWIDRGELRDEDERNDILTWGADTSVAYDVLAALEKKIDQYFAQCSLLALDGGFEKRFSAGESEVSELDVSDVAAVRARMEHASLTKPTSEERLTFDDRINPFYRTAAANFAERVLKRWKKGVRVKNALTSAEWNALKGEFAKFAEWRSAKPVGGVEKLPMEKLRAYSTAGYEKMLAPIFEKDKAVAKEIQRVEELERLILYKKHMMEFVNNFVSFSSLYDPSSLSMLQVGRLVMDARHFELNLNVSDIGKHKKTAADSNICVMYLKLTTK
ncbi:MAG: hypothetical protein KAG97_07275, partial [Victivallales bacterium]|nr:hypothetical protein [Victivallales bacterium]